MLQGFSSHHKPHLHISYTLRNGFVGSYPDPLTVNNRGHIAKGFGFRVRALYTVVIRIIQL